MNSESKKLLQEMMDLADHFGSLAEKAFINAERNAALGNDILKLTNEARGRAFKTAGMAILELVLENLRKTGRS